MNWMSKYQGVIDCTKKSISMTAKDGEEVAYTATKPLSKVHCHTSLANPALEEVPIVCEYPDVFPEELPGMPPDRDIEFVIELVPGTGPIAQKPYRMNPAELEELKKALEENRSDVAKLKERMTALEGKLSDKVDCAEHDKLLHLVNQLLSGPAEKEPVPTGPMLTSKEQNLLRELGEKLPGIEAQIELLLQYLNRAQYT